MSFPSEQLADNAAYGRRSDTDSAYEPEPTGPSAVVTINGVAVRWSWHVWNTELVIITDDRVCYTELLITGLWHLWKIHGGNYVGYVIYGVKLFYSEIQEVFKPKVFYSLESQGPFWIVFKTRFIYTCSSKSSRNFFVILTSRKLQKQI